MGVKCGKGRNDLILVVQLVEPVEERDLVEDAVKDHEEEVIHNNCEDKRLEDFGMAGKAIISKASPSEV